MLEIILKRMGSTQNLETPSYYNLPFSIEIYRHPECDQFLLNMYYSNNKSKWGNDSGQIAFRSKFPSGSMSVNINKAIAVSKVKEIFGIDIGFSDYVEAYCYIKNPIDKFRNDIYMACAKYEEESDRIIMVPEDYCLIAWEDGRMNRNIAIHKKLKPKFLVDSDVPVHIRALAKKAHTEFLKDHNQENSDFHNKGWLAWLLSEYIKETGKEPVRLKEIAVREAPKDISPI